MGEQASEFLYLPWEGADLYQGKKQENDDMKAFQILQTKQYR